MDPTEIMISVFGGQPFPLILGDVPAAPEVRFVYTSAEVGTGVVVVVDVVDGPSESAWAMKGEETTAAAPINAAMIVPVLDFFGVFSGKSPDMGVGERLLGEDKLELELQNGVGT